MLRRQRNLLVPRRLHRAYLAEEYDGVGQNVLITLARTSTSAAVRARIASGDFGGGRKFPVGTPVVVHSHRGQLEVLSLGNLPSSLCQDLFDRTVPPGPPGASSFGPDWETAFWFNPSQHISIHDGEYDIDNGFIDGDGSDYVSWVKSSRPFRFPLEVEYKFRVDQPNWPPLLLSREPFISVGIGVGGDNTFGADGLPEWSTNYSMVVDLDININNTIDVSTYSLRHAPPFTIFPSGSGAAETVVTGYDNNTPITVRIRCTDAGSADADGKWGIYSKVWLEGTSEPEDWTAYFIGANEAVDQRALDSVFIDSIGIILGTGGVISSHTYFDYVKLFGDCIEGGVVDEGPIFTG